MSKQNDKKKLSRNNQYKEDVIIGYEEMMIEIHNGLSRTE